VTLAGYDWDSVEPQQLFGAPIEKKAESDGVVRHLREAAEGAAVLVLWLDCDLEGENICFEVIEVWRRRLHSFIFRHDVLHQHQVVHKTMTKAAGGRQPQILRAKFSAVAKSDIESAMLVYVNESISYVLHPTLTAGKNWARPTKRRHWLWTRAKRLTSRLAPYNLVKTPR
jgi:DNA topoisomerase IA